MRSAIVLAGYNNRKAVEKYSRIVAENYGETYIETGYKPLREFTVHSHGKTVTKPLVQFTLEELILDGEICEIVVVGHKELLENRLGPLLAKSDKPWKIVDQEEDFPPELVSLFHINTKEIRYNSVGGNIVKGYAASAAFGKKEHALFVASDSPFTKVKFINAFLEKAEPLADEASIVMPAVHTDPKKDRLGRVPLLLVNDTGVEIHCRKDKFGRTGFRLSSVLLCNLFGMDVNSINAVYSLRKALNPKVQMRIFRICREFGYAGIYGKYFLKKNLTVRECENIFSSFTGGTFRSVPISGKETTYDYDGTEKEFREISRMLSRKRK